MPESRRTTAISWTDQTWNPVTGCFHASDGCRNCYAERLSLERGWSAKPWTFPNIDENLKLHPDRLRQPMKWPAGSKCFVNSMSDLMLEQIPDDYRDQVYHVMEQRPDVTFQILTKRPGNMARYLEARYRGYNAPTHIQHGTSIEDARVLAPRLSDLAHCASDVRFISAEPLIGSWCVDLSVDELASDLGAAGVSWIIVGGESGPGYRPMEMAWAREIRDACVAEEIAFFYKQDAAFRTETRPWLVEEDGTRWEWHQYPGHRPDPTLVPR